MCVRVIVTVCLKEKKKHSSQLWKRKFLQSDPDGCQDVPIEQKLIRRDIREGV